MSQIKESGIETNAFSHHGILGMKWGVRRFQNEDGTWTNAGKRRYSDDSPDIAGMIRDRVSRERKSKEYRDDYYNRKIRKYESRFDGSRMQSVKASGVAVVSKLLSSGSSLLSGPNQKKAIAAGSLIVAASIARPFLAKAVLKGGMAVARGASLMLKKKYGGKFYDVE